MMKNKAYIWFLLGALTFVVGGFRLNDRGDDSSMYWAGAVLMLVMAWVSYQRFSRK